MFNITKYGTFIQLKHHTANYIYCTFHSLEQIGLKQLLVMWQIDLKIIPTFYCMIIMEIFYASQYKRSVFVFTYNSMEKEETA